MPVREELSFLILVLSSGILVRVQAQQGIVLTLSGELCFGQTVTLTCTHPDPSQDPAKYLPQVASWAENGAILDLTLPATLQRFTRTVLSGTASTLSFTVTEEDHANKVVICSCFLVLNGGVGREESDPPITMDVNAKPTIMSKPDGTSGLLQWSPSPSCGTYNYQYNYNLTWVRMEDGSAGTVSTEKNWYDFTGMPGGKYTVALKTRVPKFQLEDSEPVSAEFYLTDCPQNIPAAAAGGTVSFTVLAAVSAVAGLFMVISMVLAVILVGVLVRMRRMRREEGQERKRRDPGEANVPPVPMTTNPSYAQVQHGTEKKIPLYGNL